MPVTVPMLGKIGLDKLVRGNVICMEDGAAVFNCIEKFIVALSIVAAKCLTVFVHSAGALLLIIKGIVLFSEVVFDDPDAVAKRNQSLSVFGITHLQILRNSLCLFYSIRIGSVHGREPFCKQRNLAAVFEGVDILLQLSLDDLKHGFFTLGSKERKQIVKATELGNVFKIFQDAFRLMVGQPVHDNSEYTPLSETAPDVTGVKQNLHGSIGVFRVRSDKARYYFFVTLTAQCTDGSKKVKAFRTGALQCYCTIFGKRHIRFIFYVFQHDNNLLIILKISKRKNHKALF